MRPVGRHRSNVRRFMILFVFLLTFIILLIMEVSYSTYKKSHAHGQNEASSYSQVSTAPLLSFRFRTKLYSLEEKRQVTQSKKITPLDAVWQTVDGSRFKFYVYSAFLDRRSNVKWVVRLIATTRTKSAEKPICTFHYRNAAQESVIGKIAIISENWGLPYSAVFIICSLSKFTAIPISVSVSVFNDTTQSTYSSTSNHVLVVDKNLTDLSLTKNKDKIAVCVKPIHMFDKAMKLTEFVELNRLLGISHFTFYNSSAGPSTSCILGEYVKQGLATVLPWQLEVESKTEIRTEGMFAALNDCLYRYMHLYPYVAFIDIDEFIVPRFNITLIDLIKWLSSRYNTSKISSFSFQNAFFYLQWPDDEALQLENVVERNLITLRKTRRRVKLNAHKQRSKFIVKPINVVEVGNHFVWQFFYNHNTLNVPSNVAMLNHYRVCEFGGNDCTRLPSTVDRSLHRYRNTLTCNVAMRWWSVSAECTLPNIGHFLLQHNTCNKS